LFDAMTLRPSSLGTEPKYCTTGPYTRHYGRMRRSRESKWSIGSENSVLSIYSKNSVLSIGSTGSALSVGSIGSCASVLSIGSFACLGSILSAASVWSVLSWRAARTDGRAGSGVYGTARRIE
jgi:hypothetical protein